MKSFLGMVALTAIVVTGCENGSFYSAPGGETAVDRVQNQKIHVVYQEVETQKQKVRELKNYLNSGVRDPNPTIAIKIGDHVFRSEGEDLSPAEIVEGLTRERERIRIALNVPEDVRPDPDPKPEVDVTIVPSRDELLIAALERIQQNSNRQHEVFLQETRNMQRENMAFQERMLDRLLPPGPEIPSDPVRPPDCSRPPRR